MAPILGPLLRQNEAAKLGEQEIGSVKVEIRCYLAHSARYRHNVLLT